MPQKKYLLVVPIIVLIGFIFFITRSQKAVVNPLSNLTAEKPRPSETFITYEDPAGFSFSYPDNLSLSKSEIEDQITYTDLSLYSKDVSGSINLTISDTKYKTIEEWITDQKLSPIEPNRAVMLGTLKALEIKTADHFYLSSIDQGIIFTLRIPRLEEEFWQPVYGKLRQDFAFVVPETTNTAAVPVEDSVFEGEEVVE